MKRKFEAQTIEEACNLASSEYGCTIDKLEYKIIQYPTKGILGLFAKNAIIEIENFPKVDNLKDAEEKLENQDEALTDSNEENIEEDKQPVNNEEESLKIDDSDLFDTFYGNGSKEPKESISAIELENKIKNLFENSCYDLDTIEVDIEDNTAYVFIDGVDAALLIGKEGYRYNALSYILFNWINSKYGLYLKLEIAQFLASQQDMIINQLKPVVEHVNKEGWGRTRELNGILVQIALEYLRDTFPNKYVAIKKAKNGERYIVINKFNKR